MFGKRESGMTETDQLIAYRQSGELRVLGALYEPYMEVVFAVCYKYLRDEEESKDAVMQIFEKLVNDLRTHQVENFRSWLHRVAVNYCLMQLRTKRIFVDVENGTGFENLMEYTEDTMPDLDSNMAALEGCLKLLNAEQRESIDLFFVQGKCYREISETTGFDLSKVKSYIQNGKRNLKICLDRNGGI
jgi:RNA polymerase sigma factor (sigma-70 family)